MTVKRAVRASGIRSQVMLSAEVVAHEGLNPKGPKGKGASMKSVIRFKCAQIVHTIWQDIAATCETRAPHTYSTQPRNPKAICSTSCRHHNYSPRRSERPTGAAGTPRERTPNDPTTQQAEHPNARTLTPLPTQTEQAAPGGQAPSGTMRQRHSSSFVHT